MRRRAILGAAVLALAAGCDDRDSLTAGEARALYEAVFVLDPYGLEALEAGDGRDRYRCPHGGEIEFAFTDHVETISGDTIRSEQASTVTPVECGVSARGLIFTVSGDPNVAGTLTAVEVGAASEVQITFSGLLAWQLNGGSGLCDVDVEIRWAYDEGSGTSEAAITGGMCGHEVAGWPPLAVWAD